MNRLALTELAQKMFEAYNDAGPTPWKTFDGRDAPRWPGLPMVEQDKWVAAAIEAFDTIQEDAGW